MTTSQYHSQRDKLLVSLRKLDIQFREEHGSHVTKPRSGSKSEQIRQLLRKGVPPMEVSRQMGIRPQFVYNVRRSM